MSSLGPAELVQVDSAGNLPNPHPNDVDRKRIERALEGRKRYRYVTPEVVPITNGYEIHSPCCSRRIDKEGGVVAIARLVYLARVRRWRVYRKDHTARVWKPHMECANLAQVLSVLQEDPDRSFWQ